MLQKLACTLGLLLTGATAASSPPSTPQDIGYLAALVETTYCSTSEFTTSGLKVANSTLIKSLPYSQQYAQRVDVFDDPTYGIVVAYEGTNNTDWTDFLYDIDFEHAFADDSLGLPWNALVHHGFLAQHVASWPSVKDTVESALNDNPGKNITVIGHSMGAAISQLGALALQKQFGNVEKVVAYAPPRVGNPSYAASFNDVFNDKYVALWNGQDWVPWILLPELGYLHPNNLIWINPENGTDYQYFEKSEDWSGPAAKLPKLVTIDTIAGGTSQLIETLKKGDIYGAIAPIFDFLYWGGHEGIYFGTEMYAGAARSYGWAGCPGQVGAGYNGHN